MYAPGHILLVRQPGEAVTIDVTGATPVASRTATMSQYQGWSNGTLPAGGRVLVSGGSAIANRPLGVALRNEIRDPATGACTLGATATKPRLHHSAALLLPDGSVITGGGGAPGLVANLNAGWFYPSYPYHPDTTGMPAPRPALAAAHGYALPVGVAP